jgi:hypothetical protein
MQEAQKRWMEMATPSHFHKRLEYFLGKWDTTTKMWMGGPESQPTESAGEAEYRWLMEGRWLTEEFKGQMMGMPMDGFGLFGYDNFRKQFVGCWVDNFGTAMQVIRGLLDKTGKVLIQYGTMDEPMTGEVGKAVKYVTRILDEDMFLFEIHDLGIGEDNTKVIEITYQRQKP